MTRKKETPGAVVFTENEVGGKPPIIGSLYVKKYHANGAASIAVTVDKEAKLTVDADTRRFTKKKETPGCFVYSEQEIPGTAPIIGTLYLKRWFASGAEAVCVRIAKD